MRDVADNMIQVTAGELLSLMKRWILAMQLTSSAEQPVSQSILILFNVGPKRNLINHCRNHAKVYPSTSFCELRRRECARFWQRAKCFEENNNKELALISATSLKPSARPLSILTTAVFRSICDLTSPDFKRNINHKGKVNVMIRACLARHHPSRKQK